MDQQNIAIAVGGIIVSLGILAIGFNKLSPDTYQDDGYSFNQSTVMNFKNTYPGTKRDEFDVYPESNEDKNYDRRRSETTSIIVGGRTLCKRCNTRNTRRKK